MVIVLGTVEHSDSRQLPQLTRAVTTGSNGAVSQQTHIIYGGRKVNLVFHPV